MQFKSNCNFVSVTGEQLFVRLLPVGALRCSSLVGRTRPAATAARSSPSESAALAQRAVSSVPLGRCPSPHQGPPWTRTRRVAGVSFSSRPRSAVCEVASVPSRVRSAVCSLCSLAALSPLPQTLLTALTLTIYGYIDCNRSSRHIKPYLSTRPAILIHSHAPGHRLQHHQDAAACVSP